MTGAIALTNDIDTTYTVEMIITVAFTVETRGHILYLKMYLAYSLNQFYQLSVTQTGNNYTY